MRRWRCIKVDNHEKEMFTLNKVYITDDEGSNFTDDEGNTYKVFNIWEFDSEFEESFYLPSPPSPVPTTQITFSTIESILDREYPSGWQIV